MPEGDDQERQDETPTPLGGVGVSNVVQLPPTAVPRPPQLSRIEPSVEDTARRNLAYFFIFIFAFTIAFACLAVLINHNTWPDIKELLPIIMPAETALLGSATGFYFGAKR